MRNEKRMHTESEGHRRSGGFFFVYRMYDRRSFLHVPLIHSKITA